MRFGILGPVAIWRDGRPIELRSRRQSSLLASLLVHANEEVAIERLIDYIWGDDAPESALNALQVHVFHLRRLIGLEDIVTTTRGGYVLVVDPLQVDAPRFERILASAREALSEGDAARGAAGLADALSLWRGPALADFRDAPFAQAEIARLEALRLGALEDRVEAQLSLGRTSLVGELEELVTNHPAHERFRGQLMVALYRAGRQSDALEVYRDARRFLVDTEGIEPGPKLQDLQRAILLQDPSLLSPAVRRPPMTASDNGGLPRYETAPLVGRERECGELSALLRSSDTRLVTVTGTGGVGKTRLVVEVASRLQPDFPDGVVFVPLAGLRHTALVGPAVERALGVEASEEDRALRTRLALRDRKLLVILDNFEHLLGAATTVTDLLSASPVVKVLTTSRAPLHVVDEHEYELRPLEVPDPGVGAGEVGACDAVALFVRRACAVDASFSVTPENASTVASICRRLDGLPLALELAAARAKLFAPADVLTLLDDHPELLAAREVERPARQRTIWATIEWSVQLLDEDDRRFLSRAAVFAGGFTLEAAEIAADADIIGRIASLVDKSLLQRERASAEPRFGMLDTIRSYATERLVESGTAAVFRERHAEYFCALAERSAREMTGPEQARSMQRLEVERDNCHEALRWAGESGRLSLELRLATALWRFWFVRGGSREGLGWLEAAYARAGSEPSDVRARAARAAANLAARLNEHGRAAAFAAEALAAYREEGDAEGESACLNVVARVAELRGDYAEAGRLHEQSAELSRRIGDHQGVAVSLCNMAQAGLALGDPAQAEGLSREALELARNAGHVHVIATCLLNLGIALGKLHRHDEALECLREALDLARQLADDPMRADLLVAFAWLDAHAHPERAARILGAANAVFERADVPLAGLEQQLSDDALSEARDRLGVIRSRRAWRHGHELTLDQVERQLVAR